MCSESNAIKNVRFLMQGGLQNRENELEIKRRKNILCHKVIYITISYQPVQTDSTYSVFGDIRTDKFCICSNTEYIGIGIISVSK